jgi:hypothetical protein
MGSQGQGATDAHPGVGLDLASGDRDRGKAAVHEGGGTDRRDPPVSVPQREGRGGPDERGPLVSVHVRGGAARAARVRAERAWAGLRAKFQAARCAKIFFFFFLCNFCLMFEVE